MRRGPALYAPGHVRVHTVSLTRHSRGLCVTRNGRLPVRRRMVTRPSCVFSCSARGPRSTAPALMHVFAIRAGTWRELCEVQREKARATVGLLGVVAAPVIGLTASQAGAIPPVAHPKQDLRVGRLHDLLGDQGDRHAVQHQREHDQQRQGPRRSDPAREIVALPGVVLDGGRRGLRQADLQLEFGGNHTAERFECGHLRACGRCR